jgi:glycosyltransferase involved in cell wall biosynthesis
VTLRRVLLAGFYPPPFAGEPIHVKQLADFLRDRGIAVEVLNLNRHAAPSPEYRSAASRLALMRMLFLLPDEAGVLHLHTNGHSWKSWSMITVAALATRLRGVRAILTLHSGLLPGYVATFSTPVRVVARWLLAGFERVVCVNSEIGAATESLGLSPSRIVVIPAFMGVPESGPLAPEDRHLADVFRPLLVAVAGGEANPEEGLLVVLEALRQLRQTRPAAGAVFLGWQVGVSLPKAIEESGLSAHVACLGEVSHGRCLGLIAGADVVVRSTFVDGDAITVREALSLGVPVVASDTAFRPDGVTLFRKGDAADLSAKLVAVLSGIEAKPTPRSETADARKPLWQLYCELSGREGAPK